MKPVLFKAGIPLALSLAGFILARIATRKSRLPMASSQQSRIHTDIQEPDSCETYAEESVQILEDEHTNTEAYHHMNTLGSASRIGDSHELEEQLLQLRNRIEGMQDREFQLEKRFLYYQELKDQEMALMEILNKMMLEMNRVEYMGREVSLLDAENQRFESIAVEYLKLLRLLEFFRSENEKLHKRVNKLLRKTKQHSRILRKQSMQIQWKETEISRSKKELELKDGCIKLMEDENKKLKLVMEQLQGEKDDLKFKLRAEEESTASKVEGETVSIEKYNQLALELEQVQKQEATQVKERIYPRWSNACLRHELMRKNQEVEEAEENTESPMENNFVGIEEFGSDNEVNRSRTRNRAHSRRRKLITKFKRWVEGSEKANRQRFDDKEKHGNNTGFQMHCVSDEAFLPARNSCSSV